MGFLNRVKDLLRPSSSIATKSSSAGPMIAWSGVGQPKWTPRAYHNLAEEGFRKNVIAYRCVMQIATSGSAIPWLLYDDQGHEVDRHPLLNLLQHPNWPRAYTLQRNNGTATGTITGAKESPWSNGQTGQRQSLAFTLGSGTSNEIWWYTATYNAYATCGILASDLGTNSYYAEAEIELSGIANMTQCAIELFDSVTSWNNWDGCTQTGTGAHFLQSSAEMISLPNSGKLYFRTQPMLLPGNLSNFCCNLIFGFDCSGGAGSATATVKINHVAIRKAFA